MAGRFFPLPEKNGLYFGVSFLHLYWDIGYKSLLNNSLTLSLQALFFGTCFALNRNSESQFFLMEIIMKDQKPKQGTKKPQDEPALVSGSDQKNHQKMYLEHLMRMTVGVLDRGFQKT